MKNLNVAVREWEDQVVFLHRIVEGGTDRSYGIHVARLAGVPSEVLDRARQLLSELTVQHVGRPKVSRAENPTRPPRSTKTNCPSSSTPPKNSSPNSPAPKSKTSPPCRRSICCGSGRRNTERNDKATR